MTTQQMAAAMQRMRDVLQRRPERGLHDDTGAVARWQGDARIACDHPNGTQLVTDMPVELGGTGDHATPGWLFRAALASCAATRIAMEAAACGIELTELEVRADSQSDARGLLGMQAPDGLPVPSAPCAMQMRVRLRAAGVPAPTLQALVRRSRSCSPVPAAVEQALPLDWQIDAA
ncbi:OsmC family protein [Dyella sp.]|jgi:uncharacterized OsmC-like protein|uniref:OsmC family protein n=1 Tax=Dyella sp. TaxID=1869338 RepID=UPI002D76B674|nr:OsmC family protein [Dyella sp.]HET6432729.1 OsmC family protein [Dyella sp.]